MRPSPAPVLFVFALLVACCATGVVGQPTATPTDETDRSGLTIAIQLEPDGDARWNVTARFPLQTENDTQAFEKLSEEFRNGESDVGFDTAVFEAAASEAEIQTSREMTIRRADRSAHVGEEVGTLSLSFTWTNFSRVSGTRLAVGDVFATSTGTWLPRLTAEQTLVISPPDGYTVQSAQTNGARIDDRDLVVEGPATFERGEPSVVYAGGTTPTPGDNPLDSYLPLLFVLMLSAAIAGVYALARHQGSDPLDSLWTEDADTEPVEPRPEVDGEESEPEDADEADEDEEVDPELLSDEERVIRMLEAEGGRMKQADIVKETGWSNAKVSQLLSGMAEDGQVNKLRIGRENLISLPDEEFGEFD